MMLRVFFLEKIIYLFALLPWKPALALGRFLGRIAYGIDKKHRNIAFRNLKESFKEKTDKEVCTIVKKVYENFGMNMMEFARLPRFTSKNIDGFVDYKNLNYIEQAKRKGKGILLLTGHCGNWELLSHAMGLKGYNGYVVVRDGDSPVFDKFLRKRRMKSGNKVIGKKKAMRKLLRILGRGGIVAILLDQNVTWREGVFVDFMGRKACTNKGLALMAMASGAQIVPIFIRRKDDLCHEIEVMEAVSIVDTGNKDKDILVNTQIFTEKIEEYVRRYPEQWFWLHQRWKTRPKGSGLHS